MRNTVLRSVAVAGIVVAAVLGTSGSAMAAGEVVNGVSFASTEGAAYAQALTAARDKCPDRNNVSLVSRETWIDPSGWWASITLRCN